VKQEIFPYLKRILQGADVPWKPLGEVTEVKTGQSVNKNIIADNAGEYPVINSGREPLGFINVWNTDNDPIGITSRGAGVGSITWQEGKYFRGNLNYSVSIKDFSILNTRFLYYLLLQMQFDIQALCTFQGIPALNAVNLKKLQIPIPPLSVQQEIVRILDKFTQLETELKTELKYRKQQYEHYRDELLTSDENEVEWKTLGEVAKKISSGGTPKTSVSEYYSGDIPWLRTQEVGYGEIWDTSIKITDEAVKNSSAKWIPENCIIVAMYGATVGRVGINKIPLTTNQACANIEINENIANYKYVYYCLLNQYEYIKSLGVGSQTNINAQIVKNIQIPLPPIEEQERIAGILDKFDTLVNSTSEGLPREIELRRKQYEYYREKLLSFPTEEKTLSNNL